MGTAIQKLWTLPRQKGIDHEPKTSILSDQPRTVQLVNLFQKGETWVAEAFDYADGDVWRAYVWDLQGISPLRPRQLIRLMDEIEENHNTHSGPKLVWMRLRDWTSNEPTVPIV